jgi:hypothetical protein
MSNDPKYAAKKEAIGVSMNVLTKLWSDRISSSVKDDKKEFFIFKGHQGGVKQYTQDPTSDWLGRKPWLVVPVRSGVPFRRSVPVPVLLNRNVRSGAGTPEPQK